MITAQFLTRFAYAIGNLSFDDLADAGVLKRGPDGKPAIGGSDWRRFNDDLVTFIIKLPPIRIAALARLINTACDPCHDSTDKGAPK